MDAPVIEASIIDQLTEAALAVQQNAYAPYSKFRVGAALIVPQGAVFSGCNVENASYGLSNCAERAAIAAMVGSGHKEMQAIVVASSGGVSPCGACRQVLAEFGKQCTVYCYDSDALRITQVFQLTDLLPGQFSGADLPGQPTD